MMKLVLLQHLTWTKNQPPEKKIKLDIPAAQSFSVKCIICLKSRRRCSSVNLAKLSPKQRANIFIKTGIIVTEGARACASHVNGDGLKDDCYGKVTSVSDSVKVENYDIAQLLNELRETANRKSNALNLDNADEMTDEDYIRLTGITKNQFNDVHESLSSLRSTSTRSSRTALAMLLVKLRTGLSLAVLSTLFGMKKTTCSKAIYSARVSLMSNFVPKYLGLPHIERNKVIEDHTTEFARVLFADSQKHVAIVVADGTYVYIEKQHSTEEANESRLVTKVRWVVDSANGVIKQWKALSNVLPNSQIPFAGDYVRIVCSVCNSFRPSLVTSLESDVVMAKRMMALSKVT